MKHIFIFLCLFSVKLFAQISMSPTSTIACDANSVSTSLTLTAGAAPYTFTVYGPCSPAYTFNSASTVTAMSFSCMGACFILVSDASGVLGSFTHTVLVAESINIPIVTDFPMICKGETSLIQVGNSTPVQYTIGSIMWNTGDTTSQIWMTPTVSTTYSYSAILTSTSTRTCHVEGYTTITVVDCPGSSVGITERFSAKNIRVFPNPATDKLEFEWSTKYERPIKAELIDVMGRCVKETVIENTKHEIDVAALKKGIYILKLSSEKVSITGRFIKE